LTYIGNDLIQPRGKLFITALSAGGKGGQGGSSKRVRCYVLEPARYLGGCERPVSSRSGSRFERLQLFV